MDSDGNDSRHYQVPHTVRSQKRGDVPRKAEVAGAPPNQLASDGGLFIFMFWYFHRGLEPHLQRAHAGHTQDSGGNGGQRR